MMALAQSRVRHQLPEPRQLLSFAPFEHRFQSTAADDFHLLQGNQADVRDVLEALDKSPQPLVRLDDLDDDGAVAFEDVTPMHMRRATAAEPGIQNGATRQSPFACAQGTARSEKPQ